MPIDILPAHEPLYIPAIRTLFREYESWFPIDYCFEGFEKEVAGLPGDYAPPTGRLFLGVDVPEATVLNDSVSSEALSQMTRGCIALRRIDEEICEMKRLFVRPSARGQKLGLRLVQTLLAEARSIGYRRMRLDTLPKMTDAIRLYRSLGFQSIPPYHNSATPGTLFLELSL